MLKLKYLIQSLLRASEIYIDEAIRILERGAVTLIKSKTRSGPWTCKMLRYFSKREVK